MIHKKQFVPAIKYAIGFVIVWFVINSFFSNFQDLKSSYFKINFFCLICSLLLMMLALIFQLIIWHFITRKNSIILDMFDSLNFRMKAEFGKYLPGRIALYGILLYSYKHKSISADQVVFCSINEAIASITGAILFVLVGSVFINIESFFLSMTMKVAIFLMAIGLLLPQPQRLLFALISKLSKCNVFGQNQNHFDRLLFALLFFLNWIIYGLSFYFMVKGFIPVEIEKLVPLAVLYCLSTFIGFFAFFVPAGLGVREGSLTILLAQIVPLGTASFIAVFSRIWLMICEILVFLILLIKEISSVSNRKDKNLHTEVINLTKTDSPLDNC